MGKQTEVVQAGISNATSRLDSSRSHSTYSRSQVEQVYGRQNTSKWAPMEETATVLATSRDKMLALQENIDIIIAAIEEFKSNVEITRDEFAKTDEVGHGRFTQRFDEMNSRGLDRYSVGSYDAVNQFMRTLDLDSTPLGSITPFSAVTETLSNPFVDAAQGAAPAPAASGSEAASLNGSAASNGAGDLPVNSSGNKSVDLG